MRGQEVTGKQILCRWEHQEMWCAEKEQKCRDDSQAAEFEQESCWASLFSLRKRQARGITVQDPHWHYCICISAWEQKVAVKVWHVIRGSFPLAAQRFVGKEKFMICYDEMDECMGCKMPWVLRQHPLPTLYTSCLGQGEERDTRAGPQRHFALPLFLFTCYFCMTLIMKLKTLVQLQAAILGSIASSPDTGITIFQASNLL